MNASDKTGRRFATPLALAAVLAMGAALPAQAQFFSSSGANNTFPINLFPINPFASIFDFTGNTLSIGSTAPGSFAAMAGALLKGDALSIANGGTGSGAVTVTGAGTRAELGGTTNRLEIGNWGTGSLTVSAGAVVDAGVNAAACTPGASCRNYIGNGAGSNGSLTVTGVGSELRALRYFGVGQAAVFTQAHDGFDFGTPGGTTNAVVNVLDGATLRTQQVNVGQGPTNAAALGSERAFGTVVIDGASSRWLVAPNSIDNVAAGFTAGNGNGGNATVSVRNGGQLIVDGSGGPGPNDFINLGVNGGHADMTVSGIGSSVVVKGNSPVLQVGRSGVGGQGSFSVLAGATASALFLNIGRDGASGTVLLDGAGSQINLIGVGTSAAFSSIGSNGGTGQLTVSNGGHMVISDGGADSRAGTGSPGFAIGRGAANSQGSVTITGAGSTIEIVSSSLGMAPGITDNFNPFVGVGFDAGSSAQLLISAGGRLLMTGKAVSTPGFDRVTNLSIGGRSSTLPAKGTVSVTGLGSEINVGGLNAFIGIGRGPGGSGTLNVLDQSRVFSTSMLIGETGGTGKVAIDNATVALSGFRSDSSNVGAGTTIGRGVGGNGTMTLSNGARLTIENNTLAGGMAIGGDQFVTGGTGVVSLSGGSAIEFSGSVLTGSLSVGRSGTGAMTLAGGSTVSVGTSRSVFVGRELGGTGSLAIGSGSVLSAGYVGLGSVGGAHGDLLVDGAGSQLTVVTASTGGLPSAGFLDVGRGGSAVAVVSNGARVLIGDNGGDTRLGTTNPGLQVGRDAGGSGKLTITGAASTIEIVATSLGLPPGAPDNLNPFLAVGRFAGATGELVVSNGGKLLMTGNAVSTATDSRTTNLLIGGNSDTDAGGTGTALVTGLGSEIRVSGSDALIRVGRGPGASGQLTITDQGLVSATAMNIGRVGSGTLMIDNGTLNLVGQFTSDAVTGATLSIGNRNGTGVATVANGSQINLTNLGTNGANLNLGGTGPNPLGNGTMTVSGGSQIRLTAASELATFQVGRDGTGFATFKGGSSIDIGDGSTYIGRLAGSTGTLRLETGSALNAGYVGVGRSQAGDGGTGKLIVSNSTLTANTIEIGSAGLLGGNGGTVNGDVILHGVLSPGESLGRIVINGTFRTGSGQLVLEVGSNGNGGFDTDHLILTRGSTFGFDGVLVTFVFLSGADPNAFAATGGFDMDTFLQSLDIGSGVVSGLSDAFAPGQTWSSVLATATFSANSDDYALTDFKVSADGSVTFHAVAVAVPEPSTWALMFVGLATVSSLARRRAVRG